MRFKRNLLLLLLLFYTCYHVMGQYSDTDSIYRQVIAIDESNVSPEKKLTVLYQLKSKVEVQRLLQDSSYTVTLIKIAKYECFQNHNYKLALQYNSQALALLRHIDQSSSDKLLINAYFNQASYYQSLLQYSNALACYDTVTSLSKKDKTSNYITLSSYAKAKLYFDLGDYQKFTDESNLGINSALQLQDTTSYVSLINYRGYSLIYSGQLSQALADANTAIDFAQKQNNFFELANAFNTKAIVYDKQKNYKAAEYFFKKSIAARARSKSDYETIVNDYNELANFYLYSLNDFEKAKKNYEVAIELSKHCDTIKKRLVLFMLHVNLAEAAARRHLYNESVQHYNLALSYINIKTSDALLYNLFSNELALIRNTNVLFPFLFNKTALLLQLYKKTHQPSYLRSCQQSIMLTDTLITHTRHENLDERSKLFWRNETRDFFTNAMEACYLAGNAGKAFYFMEKSRAVLLNDRLNEIGASAHLPPAEAAKEENFQIKIIEEQQKLSLLNPSSKEFENRQINYLKARNELERYIKSLEQQYPAYYQYKYADDVPTLQSLQQYLAQNKLSFVYYFINDTSMYALAIMPAQTKFIKINAYNFNRNQLSAFTRLCSNKSALNNNYASFTSLSQTIYNKMFAPLQLSKGSVAICSDNFFIPFEALYSDTAGKHFLLYDYNFSYVYAARSLLKPFTANKAGGNFVGFAPVSFSKKLNLVDLKQSADALSEAASFYSANTLITQQNATRNSFFHNVSDYAVITIFSHAQADTTDKEPRLFMADSVIHLSELQSLKNVAAQFVLLSACQTNTGKTATGEGVYSLARGFAAAGIPSVAATLWSADEQTIYAISKTFNQYLAAGMNKSEALQKAKINFLQQNSGEYTLPYYWANMILIGDAQPLRLSNNSHNFWWWIAGIVSGCILLLWFFIGRFKLQRHKSTEKQKGF